MIYTTLNRIREHRPCGDATCTLTMDEAMAGLKDALARAQTALEAARWYSVNKDGAATLCTCEEDAEAEAAKDNAEYPRCAPHRAMQLIDVVALATPASTGGEHAE